MNQLSASSFAESPESGSKLAARQSFRAIGRRLQRDGNNISLHQERLMVALALDGAEPIQGALVDFLFACDLADITVKRVALQQVRHRLNPLIAQVFETHLGSKFSPTVSRMATRWSIFVSPSLDVPRRALRCSADDSRAFAKSAIMAWHSKDETLQQAFLEHCLVCKDTLAFMLARRAILQVQNTMPPTWSAVGSQLEQAVLAT